jgi:hypothetical protein
MMAVRFVHLKYLYRFEDKATQGLVSPVRHSLPHQ